MSYEQLFTSADWFIWACTVYVLVKAWKEFTRDD